MRGTPHNIDNDDTYYEPAIAASKLQHEWMMANKPAIQSPCYSGKTLTKASKKSDPKFFLKKKKNGSW